LSLGFNDRRGADILSKADRKVLKHNGNWRVLQSKQPDASEPLQLELPFPSR
jgi:hypothetical protein